MRYKKTLLIFLGLVFLVMPLLVSATLGNMDVGTRSAIDALDRAVGREKGSAPTGLEKQNDIYLFIGTFVNYILSIVGIILVIMVIYGGIVWMSAGGDEAKVEKAKGIISAAVVGLVIVLSAYAISYFVLSNISAAIKG